MSLSGTNPEPTSYNRRKARGSQSSGSDTSDPDRRSTSTGRGGVGNFSGSPAQEEDYKLPTLKAPRFTSGRGGQGNMQRNDLDHPEYARASQDVEMPVRRPSASGYHGVRGGAGNVFRPSQEELLTSEEYAERVKYDKSVPVDHSRHDYRGWADKGKDLLFGRRRRS